MKKILKTNSIILILVLMFNMLFPILSKAADDDTPNDMTTVTFQDGNLYNAMVTELGDKVTYKNDAEKTIYITLSNIQTVTTLNLSNKGIKNISGLEKFGELTKLYMNVNEISDISPISNLTKLEWLNLENNKISDISSLSKLTSVVYLNLAKNEITNIAPLSTLTNVTYLYLANNKITDVSALSTLVNIKDLTLNNNELENTTGLSNLERAQVLHLQSNKITDISALATLTNLTTLSLSNNKLTDISALSNLTKLKTLCLDTNNVTNFTPISNLTTLETLYLSDMGISDITFLTNLINVKYLYLSKNNISDISALANLTELNILSLGGNSKLTDISKLATCTKMTKLYLHNNNITDVSALEGMTKLTDLGIGNNKIRDLSVIDELSSVKLVNNWDIYSYDNAKNLLAKMASNYQIFKKVINIEDVEDEIVLPKIFTQVKNKKSKIYASEGLEFENCYLSSDGKNLIVTPSSNEDTTYGESTVTIKNGPLANTKYIVRVNDKIPPVLEVRYSATEPTKNAIVVTIVSNKELKELEGWSLSEDKLVLTKIYTQNVEEKITVEDSYGNNATANIKVNNIDITAPEFNVEYSTTAQTNKNVIVTVKVNEKIKEVEGWSLSDDKLVLTKTYTQNAEEKIVVEDLAGNSTTVDIKVSNIDITALEVNVEYSTTVQTNRNVIVTVKANKKIQQPNGWILGEDGLTLTKEYSQNAEEKLDIYDLAGNKREIEVKINNIDKVAPQAEVEYSTTGDTVTVTVKVNEKIQQLEGWTLGENHLTLTKVYAQDEQEEITLKDLAGNETKVTITVNNIDDLTAPEADLQYSTTEATNKNVTVTIKANEKIQEVQGWNLSTDKLTLTKEYTQNGEEEITIKDLAGNEKVIPIKIENIDKILPEAQIEYSTTKLTNGIVTVKITVNEKVQQLEGWSLDGNGTTLTKTYTQNIEEEIALKDLAGNERKVSVSVKNIDTTIPEVQVQYSTTKKTNEKVTVTLTTNEVIQEVEGWTLSNDKQTLTKVYAENAEEEITVKDLAGNERKILIKISNIEKEGNKGDNTIAGGEIPQAGQSLMVIISALAIMVLGIVSYVKLRKFKDVK